MGPLAATIDGKSPTGSSFNQSAGGAVPRSALAKEARNGRCPVGVAWILFGLVWLVALYGPLWPSNLSGLATGGANPAALFLTLAGSQRRKGRGKERKGWTCRASSSELVPSSEIGWTRVREEMAESTATNQPQPTIPRLLAVFGEWGGQTAAACGDDRVRSARPNMQGRGKQIGPSAGSAGKNDSFVLSPEP
jgi:hypothetical protein